jgi:hypothetical protein
VSYRDWQAKRHMKDPVRGTFRVTGFYDAHPHSNPPGTRITGVITAPGIPATPAEHKTDAHGRWAGAQELPVLVDRADPSRFAVLWSEVGQRSWRDQEQEYAQAEADRLNAAGTDPGTSPSAPASGGPVVFTSAVVTQDGAGSIELPPEVAAGLQGAIGEALRAAGLGGVSDLLGAAAGNAPGTAGGGLGDPAHPGHGPQAPERATAVVIAAHDAPLPPGTPLPPGGLVDITLDVTRAGGSGYTTVTRVGFATPERRARVATVGTRLAVHLDPADQSRVTIDTTGLG